MQPANPNSTPRSQQLRQMERLLIRLRRAKWRPSRSVIHRSIRTRKIKLVLPAMIDWLVLKAATRVRKVPGQAMRPRAQWMAGPVSHPETRPRGNQEEESHLRDQRVLRARLGAGAVNSRRHGTFTTARTREVSGAVPGGSGYQDPPEL